MCNLPTNLSTPCPPSISPRLSSRKPLPVPPFLPMTRREMQKLGWDELDILIITGDAYVDHPCFGMAILGKWLVAHGYRVGIIAQPRWTGTEQVTSHIIAPPHGFLPASWACLGAHCPFQSHASDRRLGPCGLAVGTLALQMQTQAVEFRRHDRFVDLLRPIRRALPSTYRRTAYNL